MNVDVVCTHDLCLMLEAEEQVPPSPMQTVHCGFTAPSLQGQGQGCI